MTELGNQLEAEKEREVFQKAYQLFTKKPDWVTFFREILGVSGVVRRNYTARVDMEEFEQTETYATIQQMLTKLREGNGPPPEKCEPNRVITVRLPKSLHDLLREEAHEHRTSMNKLCISKLLRMIDNELVPDNR
jgi:predicted HicB family RNase H-like nuclease